ncbi:hypothetical protein R69888_03603 [Paraburkholderia haematera]|jgi:hypothetical protein|uniref:Uncharacterized protein n=1 Tax=Paraburkholderia haematera TaxID=2793077 RepID=A0ABM8RPY1_9BURK|nr:hypothetical protein R69888_03603 [Paraburkholderia haematera]
MKRQMIPGNKQRDGSFSSSSTYSREYLQGYIDAKGKVQDSLKKAPKDNTLVLPIEFETQRAQISCTLW